MTLTEAFADLQDPRWGPAQRYDLREMILMALCAVLCGADTWVDVAEWSEDNEVWLRRYLTLAHGTPSHDRAAWPWATHLAGSSGCSTPRASNNLSGAGLPDLLAQSMAWWHWTARRYAALGMVRIPHCT